MQNNPEPEPARRKVRIGIVCNRKTADAGPAESADEEAEFDAPETVQAIAGALERHGAETVILEAGRTLPQRISDSGIDMVFNIAEGRNGRCREAQVPALLDMLGIPYTGSDAAAMCVSLDKIMCKRLVSASGVRTAASVLIRSLKDIPDNLNYPVLIKPDAEGSGKGISENCVAADRAELEQLVEAALPSCGDLLAEEYLPGREFTVGILGNGKDRKILPPMEILYKGNTQKNYKVYSFDVKCNYKKYVRYECPASLTAARTAELSAAAGNVFDALGCADVARADFRMDAEGRFCFLEINPLPGLAPGYSDLPMIAEAAGIGYDELVCRIYEAACRRLGRSACELL
jgi:D-alanine-D-alanine ligase